MNTLADDINLGLFGRKATSTGVRAGQLTTEQVVKIRTEYAFAYKNTYQLASEYRISQATVQQVVQGSTYKYAGGLLTWPARDGGANAHPLPTFLAIRGHCRNVDCTHPISSSIEAQRTYQCDGCFALYGTHLKRRQKKGKQVACICRVCQKEFEYYKTRHKKLQVCCSAACGIALSAKKRSRRPSEITAERLYELYWGQGLTLKEIAATLALGVSADAIRLWMVADGLSFRSARRRRLTSCAVEGCGQPIHEKKAWYGTGYGTMCYEHGKERDTKRRHYYEDQIQQERGGDLMRAIATFTAGLPDAVKMDAEQEIMIAALSGDIPLPLSRESVKPIIAKVFRENADAWKFVSIAAPTRDGEDAQTWGERLGIS